MRAKFINESLTDNDVDKIKDYAEKNNLDFSVNRIGTPSLLMDVYHKIVKRYDQRSWPALVIAIKYTFTFTDQHKPISLRKIWYGYEADTEMDLAIFVKQIEILKKLTNEGIKHLTGRDPKEIEELATEALKKMTPQQRKHFSEPKNLKQSLMGRYATIEEALDRVSVNYPKDRRKK